MKKRLVNLKRSDENIADQYLNIFEGLQKDAAQNSWDAKATKKGQGWKLLFRYIKDINTLVIEDYGTLGMDEKRWEKYQNLWDTEKADSRDLGARGQGKFLFHYFSADKRVLTETIDQAGIYRFSYGTTEEWDEDKTLQDFIPGAKTLDHQGTRIWILNIKKDLIDDLTDYKQFMRYISATWWEIIRNWQAEFIVNFDGVDRKVALEQMPASKKEQSYKNDKIKNLGQARNLIMEYCEEVIPENLRGIAVQRGGMTIVRVTPVADEAIKNRIYGYIDFDKDLEAELKRVENPNHFGFSTKRAWNYTKEYIIKKLDDFIQQISPQKEQIKVDQRVIDEAIKEVNNLIRDYVPELSPTGTAPTTTPLPHQPRLPRPTLVPLPVRIDIFKGNSRKIEYDENLIIDCEIVNEIDRDITMSLWLEIKHESGSTKHSTKYKLTIEKNSRKKVALPIIDFKEKKDAPGEYKVAAALECQDSSVDIKGKSFTFYLHEDPPKQGGIFLKNISFLPGKNKPFERQKQLPITDKGVLYIVWDHPDFIHIRDQAGSRRKSLHNEIHIYIIKCGIDGAVQKLLELKNNENQLDMAEIRRIKVLGDKMCYDTLAASVATQ